MKQVIKVALPGYNAETDTDPDHFALYVDASVDYILIKEKTYATVTVTAGDSTNIAHNLGYVPFCLVFVESSGGVWRKVFGTPIDGAGASFTVDDTNLTLYNNYATNKSFSYHIFYDKIA